MSVKIQARGVERTLQRLSEMGDTSRIERALDQAAQIVERDAALHAPFDTGMMASHLYVESPDKLTRVIGTDVPQAVYTEYAPLLLKHGTVENPRQGPWPYQSEGKLKGTKPGATMPWLRPALYRNTRRIRELISRAIGRRGE